MVNCLRAPMASSLPCSPPLSSSLKRYSFRTLCSMNSYKFLVPPPNPKDLLLPNLAPVAANSPLLLDSQKNPDKLLMDTPGEIEMDAPPDPRKSRSMGPMDPATDMLCERIIYIGTPLFPAVSQLVSAQLMYLQRSEPEKPIYMYIHSTGTTIEDGNSVASESEGLAIYDMMMLIEKEIHTICMGRAVGQACLLLAAGTKGKRYIMPNAIALIKQPNAPRLGLMQTSDVVIHTKQAKRNRDTYIELLSRHTGSSIETINNVMRNDPAIYLDATKAIEFGLVDKIFQPGDGKMSPGQVIRKNAARDTSFGAV